MKTLELDNNERFAHWDALVGYANAAFKKESALIYESLRELARNQRVVMSRLRAGGKADDGTYCDIIEPGKPVLQSRKETIDNVENTIVTVESHDTFAVLLRVQTDESGDVPPLEYGYVRFQRLGADQPVQKSNLETGENAPPVDKQILGSLTAGLRGTEELSFMYTPYVMMLQRLMSLDLTDVNIDARPEIMLWSMQAVAGDYLITTEFDFDKVRAYFGL